MASGAGQNRVYAIALSNINSTTTTVSSPTSAYGTLGANDSGLFMPEAMHFTKWTFSLLNPVAGLSVSCYGTVDPVARGVWMAMINPGNVPVGVPGSKGDSLPASSWFLLPGPSEQSGTGSIANPLTSTNPILVVSMPLLAVRVVLTGTNTAASGSNTSVAIEAVP